jgi:hypothetical protein
MSQRSANCLSNEISVAYFMKVGIVSVVIVVTVVKVVTVRFNIAEIGPR